MGFFLELFDNVQWKTKVHKFRSQGILYDQSAPERKINLVLIERIQVDENMEFNNMAYQEI